MRDFETLRDLYERINTVIQSGGVFTFGELAQMEDGA